MFQVSLHKNYGRGRHNHRCNSTKASESSSLFAVDDALFASEFARRTARFISVLPFHTLRRGKKGNPIRAKVDDEYEQCGHDSWDHDYTAEDARTAASFPSLLRYRFKRRSIAVKDESSMSLLYQKPEVLKQSISPRSSKGSKGGSPFFKSVVVSRTRRCAICMCRLDDVESPRVSREDGESVANGYDGRRRGGKRTKRNNISKERRKKFILYRARTDFTGAVWGSVARTIFRSVRCVGRVYREV